MGLSLSSTGTLRRTHIAGVAVNDLVAQYGTPTYVYDADQMVAQLERLRDFDVIRYAQKSNSHLAVLSLMRQRGALLDAVSAGELLRAEAAGFTWTGEPPPVVYTADVFAGEALPLVVQHGVHVNAGSPDMIEQYGKQCPGSDLTLRINPGFGHGHSQKTNTGGPQSKHGIWHEQVPEAIELCRRYGLAVRGLHMHIGSGSDFEHLAQVCQAMERSVIQVGESLRTISAGGGLPTPYRPGDEEIDTGRYFEIWDESRRRMQQALGHDLLLEVEPGRFPVAQAGYLLAEICAIKTMGSNVFYLVDAGFNNLPRPILYGAYHPISIAAQDGRPMENEIEVVVAGPLCESGDIFTQADGGVVQKRRLPQARVGDYLVIECAGAYSFCMSSNYNSHPLAAEVWIENGKHQSIRPRQSLRQLFAAEAIPSHLAVPAAGSVNNHRARG